VTEFALFALRFPKNQPNSVAFSKAIKFSCLNKKAASELRQSAKKKVACCAILSAKATKVKIYLRGSQQTGASS